ncbi:MAG: glycosyltransferase family 4 protein, partial [bacterium]|nr:glycosyltransferase family 4 protein [bacterium]
HFYVESFLFKPGSALRLATSQFQLLFWLMFNIPKAHLVYIWFADYHSILPIVMAKVFLKKSAIVLGGMDAIKIPEVNQGVYLRPFRGLCAALSIRFCDLLIPCDESLIETVNSYAKQEPFVAGVKHFVKYFRTPYIVIPFGFDSKKWKPGTRHREKLALTVAVIKNMNKLRLKGIDLFMEVANRLPHYKFMIIGASGWAMDFINKNKPENVTITGPVNNDELVEHYQRAKVYVQLSLSEGLPNVLCEAMLCGCVPVGSDVNGIPTAIGDAGYIVKKRDVKLAVAAVKAAMESEPGLSQAARERMVQHFRLDQREQKLITAIHELIK